MPPSAPAAMLACWPSGCSRAAGSIGLDRDAGMLELARRRLEGLPVTLVQANFDQPARGAGRAGHRGGRWRAGRPGHLLRSAGRGGARLQFQPGRPAGHAAQSGRGRAGRALLQRLNERELADLIYEYGEERFSRRIARKIVEARQAAAAGDDGAAGRAGAPLRAAAAAHEGRNKPPIDPATRVFQALRIAVNDELGALDRLLALLPGVREGGRQGGGD